MLDVWYRGVVGPQSWRMLALRCQAAQPGSRTANLTCLINNNQVSQVFDEVVASLAINEQSADAQLARWTPCPLLFHSAGGS